MSEIRVAVHGSRAHKPVAAPAIEALIEDCYPQIRRAAFVLTGRDSDADDLAQETMLQAIRSVERFEGQSRFETWVYGILLNQEKRLRRGRQRRQRLVEFVGHWTGFLHASNGSAADLDDREWRDSLWGQVARLPPAQRECIFLRYSEGLNCEAIAQIVGCPLGTVKSRIYHGLATLRATAGVKRART